MERAKFKIYKCLSILIKLKTCSFSLFIQKEKIENTRDAHIVPLFFRAHPGNLVASKILVATHVAAAKVDTAQ